MGSDLGLHFTMYCQNFKCSQSYTHLFVFSIFFLAFHLCFPFITFRTKVFKLYGEMMWKTTRKQVQVNEFLGPVDNWLISGIWFPFQGPWNVWLLPISGLILSYNYSMLIAFVFIHSHNSHNPHESCGTSNILMHFRMQGSLASLVTKHNLRMKLYCSWPIQALERHMYNWSSNQAVLHHNL